MQPGTRVSPVASSRTGFTRYQVLLRRSCIPALYIDGTMVRRAGERGLYIDEFVRPDEILGIEVYRGSSEIPLQYGGTLGTCGVVLIWTR